jgi:hypothetical protein
LENQGLIQATDVTVSGELVKVRPAIIFVPCEFTDATLSTSFQPSHGNLSTWTEYTLLVSADRVSHTFGRFTYPSGDGPRRIEIVTVDPKPDVWEQAVWQVMVSHLQLLSDRGAPNGRRFQIAAGLAGKLGPVLVGCEVRRVHSKFLKFY